MWGFAAVGMAVGCMGILTLTPAMLVIGACLSMITVLD